MSAEIQENTDLKELRDKVRKLSSRAVKAKMDLHDLAEDLPVNWESIPEVAGRTFEIYGELQRKRQAIKVLEG